MDYLEDIPTSRHRGPIERVEVEVILDAKRKDELVIRPYEDAKAILLPRHGIRISRQKGSYATLSLPESKAISYNLV